MTMFIAGLLTGIIAGIVTTAFCFAAKDEEP